MAMIGIIEAVLFQKCGFGTSQFIGGEHTRLNDAYSSVRVRA